MKTIIQTLQHSTDTTRVTAIDFEILNSGKIWGGDVMVLLLLCGYGLLRWFSGGYLLPVTTFTPPMHWRYLYILESWITLPPNVCPFRTKKYLH